MMRRVLVIGSYSISLVNFRGKLIESLVGKGYDVIALAPVTPGIYVEDKLRKIGASYQSYNLNRTGMNVFADAVSFFSLRRIIKRLHPDIVLLYTIKPVIYGSLSSASLRNKPEIYSIITGLGYSFSNDTFMKRVLFLIITHLYSHAMKHNRHVFFQNPDDRALFIEKKLVKKNQTVLVNGSGVDLRHYDFARPHMEPLTFLFVGRLIREKGIYQYVEAARILKKKYANLVFHVIGNVDENPSSISKEEVDQWIAENTIVFWGWVMDIREILKKTSVFVLPSYYREGQPRTILEAMAMGRPVVTTDSVGCRETVKHGVNGFLVPVKNSVSLADAIEQFIIHPELIASMGRESRKIAEEKYDVHRVNKVIFDAMNV